MALAWLRDLRGSEAFTKLDPTVQGELEFAARVTARCFTHRWSHSAETQYALNEVTSEDAIDIMCEQLPRHVSAVAPHVLIDALVAFLVWAAKTNRILDRSVEYACRKSHRDAEAAMLRDGKWSLGKSIVTRAMRDGVDPSDLGRLREHAIGSGLREDLVDEFLPPPPVSLGDSRWLWTDDELPARG